MLLPRVMLLAEYDGGVKLLRTSASARFRSNTSSSIWSQNVGVPFMLANKL